MIVLTGAAGFIGSCLLKQLNDLGHIDLVIVDEFSRKDKNRNLIGKQFIKKIHRDQLFDWLAIYGTEVKFVFHLGARTDTTEKNKALFDSLNLNYSKKLWLFCVKYNLPFIYASSAATYGLGTLGYDDNHQIVKKLKPLNPYGDSKNDFDKWALKQPKKPPQWAGLKFFNVYGPNEYHKGRMASVIFHTFNQIQVTNGMKLFRSHRPDFDDGKQCRDFIYVKDVIAICTFFLTNQPSNGLYNVGTGTARTFWDLAANTFLAMGKETIITFIDTPQDIRNTYQYYTQANMQKLFDAGYTDPFYSLEDGVAEYVNNYLERATYF